MDKSVDGLLKVPFPKRTKEEQLVIILEGKPRPLLSLSNLNTCGKAETFDPACYDKETWLTACDKRHTFFCWACLLFASEVKSIWTTAGFGNYGQLYDGMSRHKMVTDHINAVLQLQLFVRENISVMATLNTPQPSDLVRKNRDILRRVLDIIHHIATRIPCPSDSTTLNLDEYIKETCIDALSLSPNYDMDSTAEEAVNLVKSTEFLNHVITVLSNMVKSRLGEEMQKCNHASIILSEHSDVTTHSKMSIIVRYLKDGKVYERFTGFLDKKQKGPDSVGEYMIEVLSQYGIQQNKVIAFSCDGAMLPTAELEKFVFKVLKTDVLDSWLFVPCHLHRLDIVLEQSVSHNAIGAKLFKTLTSIRNCFLKTHKMKVSFVEFINVDLSTSNWHFAMSMRVNRKRFVRFFKRVVQDPEEWTDDDVAKAVGFYKVLEEFETIFLLEVLFAVSDHLEELINILRGSWPEDSFDSYLVNRLLAELNSVGLDFTRLWDLACAQMSQSSPQTGSSPDQISQTMATAGVQRKCRQLFKSVMVCLTKEIDIRFSSKEMLHFVHLLGTGKIKLREVPKGMIVCGRELAYIQLNKELRAVESVFDAEGKTLLETLEVLSSSNLKSTFKHTCSLAEIILTLPFKAYGEQKLDSYDEVNESARNRLSYKPIPLQGNSTKLDVINFWSTFTSPVTNDWSIICIEQDVFKFVTSQTNFFNECVCRFQVIDSTVQLV